MGLTRIFTSTREPRRFEIDINRSAVNLPRSAFRYEKSPPPRSHFEHGRPARSVRRAPASLRFPPPEVPSTARYWRSRDQGREIRSHYRAPTQLFGFHLRASFNCFNRSLTRLNGCCGLDGCDGSNLVCARGHEVATEVAPVSAPARFRERRIRYGLALGLAAMRNRVMTRSK